MSEIKSSNNIFTFREILFYFLTVFYPNYIIISFKAEELNNFNKSVFNFLGLEPIIKDNEDTFYFLFWLSIFFIPALAFFFKKKFENSAIIEANKALESRNNIYKRLLVVLNQVLELKRKRFKGFLDGYKSEKINDYDIFENITQPLAQMVKIFEGISYNFSKHCNNENIKISIIKCKNNRLHNYTYHSDDLPNIDVTELQKQKSTAKQVLATKKMIIIESTEKCGKIWYYSNNSEIKSLICYPVKVGSVIEYIISVSSKTIDEFKVKERSTYELILDELSNRIILEHYLEQIKDIKNGQKITQE